MLLGLGTVGIASAGAGLGTTAYFNDTESFDGNSLQAGSLDLRVHFASQYNRTGEPLFATATGVRDGVESSLNGAATSADFVVVVDDLKPGDSGSAEFCFEVEDNPAYLSWELAITDTAENGYTEPEPDTLAAGDTNDPGDPSGAGELQDAMMVYVSTTDGTYAPDDSLSYLLGRGDVYAGSLAALSEREFYFDHDPSTPLIDTVPGSTDGPVAPCLGIEFEIPTSVENEIQTDSVTFDLTFHAVQARHNEIDQTVTVGPAQTTGPSPVFSEGYQSGDGALSFVSGPATPPLGDGSVQLSTLDGDDRYVLFSYDYGSYSPAAGAEVNEGLALADVTTLAYSTYGDSATLAPVLKAEIDPDGPNVSGVDDYGTLNFEPYYANTVTPGVWQTWDVLADGACLWISGVPSGQEASMSNPVTWTRLLELYPDATVRFGFGVGVGGGWGAFTGHVDNLRVGVDGQTTTYDFDPAN